VKFKGKVLQLTFMRALILCNPGLKGEEALSSRLLVFSSSREKRPLSVLAKLGPDLLKEEAEACTNSTSEGQAHKLLVVPILRLLESYILPPSQCDESYRLLALLVLPVTRAAQCTMVDVEYQPLSLISSC
jgi:hypothetical protein